MSKGRIRPANKQFYTNNDYELTLGNETTIEEVEREREFYIIYYVLSSVLMMLVISLQLLCSTL